MTTITNCEQGSDRWTEIRRGRPTASGFGSIVTPKQCKIAAPSVQQTYIVELLVAALRLENESAGSKYMQRGLEYEENARASYEWDTMRNVETVAFCFGEDTNAYGCSPDGLISDNGGLECKVPGPKALITYHQNGGLPGDYISQVYGALYVTQRDYWDFYAYSCYKEIPHYTYRVEASSDHYQKWAAAFSEALPKFLESLQTERKRYKLPALGSADDLTDLEKYSPKSPRIQSDGAVLYRGEVVTAF